MRSTLLIFIIGIAGMRVCAAENSAIDDLVDAGRSIYETGQRISGASIRATVHDDVELPAAAAACANCHRRSGLGISEGGARSLNVTAAALFAASTVPPQRPAYDDGTLVRAIVSGVAADGRRLHANMPRYDLNATDAAALVAYLRNLGSKEVDGVSPTTIVVATVIADTAEPEQQYALETLLTRYVKQHNAKTRNDAKRAAAARHEWGRARQRAYRDWELKVWRLRGNPGTWAEQLELYYEDVPPFAILSGALGPDATVLHEFCEARQVPCLLPLSDPPTAVEDDFYTLYFSAGIRLEASIMADYLLSIASDQITIIHDGTAKADAMLDAIRAASFDTDIGIVEKKVRPAKIAAAKTYRELRRGDADVLIALQSADTIVRLLSNWPDNQQRPARILTTDSFTDWLAVATVPAEIEIRHIYPYSIPVVGRQQFPREYLWLRQNKLLDIDRITALKALFASRAFGMGLTDIQSNFSREYFIEVLEHALDNTQLTSLYPRTSIGPDQRLLSRGAYVVRVTSATAPRYVQPVWLQP